MKFRGLLLTGAILWIAGLVMSIVGMNLAGDTAKWMQIVGNILFLVGLGVEGVVWMKKRKDDTSKE